MKVKLVTAYLPAGTVEIRNRGRDQDFYLKGIASLEEKFGRDNLSVYCSTESQSGWKPWGVDLMAEVLGREVLDLCEQVRIAAPTGYIRVDNKLFSAVMHSKVQLLAKELRDNPDLTHVYWIDAGIPFSGGPRDRYRFSLARQTLNGLNKFNAPHTHWMRHWNNHERGEAIERWVGKRTAVAGTSFGGDRDSVLWVAKLYRKVLLENLQAGLHTVDEDILTIINLRNPGLIILHSYGAYFWRITKP